MAGKLNLDIAGSVSELESLLKKVLPKNIFYRLVLGKGVEFDGYRDYTYNEDASNIDWKASVRAQKEIVRKYIEERDLKFMFFIDVGDDMVFGSTEKLKCEYSAELSASLIHLILGTGDRVGYVLFNDDVVRYGEPKLGRTHFDILVNYLSDATVYGGVSNLNKILEEFIQTIDKSISMVFLVSDFVNVNESYRKNFEILSAMFETVAIIIRDPLDVSLPLVNKEIIIEDPETNQRLLINPKLAKNIYEKNSLEQLEFVKNLFRENNIDFLEISTQDSFAEKFTEFAKSRIMGGRKVKS